MDERLEILRGRLVAEGVRELAAPRRAVEVTGAEGPDGLTNDIDCHPHAFVLACLLDRQMPSERSWRIPWLVGQRLGSFEIDVLASLDEWDWEVLLKGPPALHRLPGTMARVMTSAVRRIVTEYAGDASRIWSDAPPSRVVVRRFREFHGAGPRIAAMATNILVTGFHVPLADLRDVDLVADVHVTRIMARLGFVDAGAGPAEVMRVARELNPEFPGVFDVPLFDVGQRFCLASNPRCFECPLRSLCAYAGR